MSQLSLKLPICKSLMGFKDKKQKLKHYRLSGKYNNNKTVR